LVTSSPTDAAVGPFGLDGDLSSVNIHSSVDLLPGTRPAAFHFLGISLDGPSMKLFRRDQQESGGEPALLNSARIEPPLVPPRVSTVLLGELLEQRSLIDAASLARMVASQAGTSRRLGSLLVEHKLISEADLASALSDQLGIPELDLRQVVPPEEALALVNESVARNLQFIPVALVDRTVDVVCADPLDDRLPGVLRALKVDLVQVFMAPASQVRDSINSAYKALSGIDEFVDGYATDNAAANRAAAAPLDLGGIDSPVVEVVNRLVSQALRDRASDIHLEPKPDQLRVRFRIDGSLNEVISLPAGMGPAIISRLKIMADMNIVEKRRPQDGQFQTMVDGRELDVRVSTTATIFGEKAVLRLLDKSKSTFSLTELGMPRLARERYDEIVNSPYGMMIVAGPTGSGKTTTLYATLSQLARPELNVMTIEDPVEYVFPDINQIEINTQADITFATGLRSILRQDPDIILVGEVRDAETARIAVQSALTGHLVLSSIHATDAASALYRLLDMGIERFLVASALTGVVAQRLVRKICSSCKAPYDPPAHEIAYYKDSSGPPKKVFSAGIGCAYCSGTGYRGRVGVYEILQVDDEIRYALVNNAGPQEIRELSSKLGMRSLREEAARLIATDVTTIDEVMRTVYTLGSATS
jgi:type IV pilus assembly protein PilB